MEDSWVFQPVVNVCIEILLLILFGYLVACLKILKSDHFLPQVNLFLLRVSIPVFTVYQLGIRLDLADVEAWRTLAAYVLWVSIIQVLIVAYVWIFCKKHWAEAGLLNLLLTSNNTIMIGLPIMEATWGKAGRFIALLTAVIIFIQILPFSIATFENENWKAKRRAQLPAPPHPPPPDQPSDSSSAAAVDVMSEKTGSPMGVGTAPKADSEAGRDAKGWEGGDGGGVGGKEGGAEVGSWGEGGQQDGGGVGAGGVGYEAHKRQGLGSRGRGARCAAQGAVQWEGPVEGRDGQPRSEPMLQEEGEPRGLMQPVAGSEGDGTHQEPGREPLPDAHHSLPLTQQSQQQRRRRQQQQWPQPDASHHACTCCGRPLITALIRSPPSTTLSSLRLPRPPISPPTAPMGHPSHVLNVQPCPAPHPALQQPPKSKARSPPPPHPQPSQQPWRRSVSNADIHLSFTRSGQLADAVLVASSGDAGEVGVAQPQRQQAGLQQQRHHLQHTHQQRQQHQTMQHTKQPRQQCRRRSSSSSSSRSRPVAGSKSRDQSCRGGADSPCLQESDRQQQQQQQQEPMLCSISMPAVATCATAAHSHARGSSPSSSGSSPPSPAASGTHAATPTPAPAALHTAGSLELTQPHFQHIQQPLAQGSPFGASTSEDDGSGAPCVQLLCAHCGVQCGVLDGAGRAVLHRAESSTHEEGEGAEGSATRAAKGRSSSCQGSSSSSSSSDGRSSGDGNDSCGSKGSGKLPQWQRGPGRAQAMEEEVEKQRGESKGRGWRLGSSLYTASLAIRDGAKGRGKGLAGLLAVVGIPNPSQAFKAQSARYRDLTRYHTRHYRRAHVKLRGWRDGCKIRLRRARTHLSNCIEHLPEGVKLALVILKNPLLWALFIAIIVSCSGLRQFLDPDSPNFKLEVGWITNVLKIISGTTVPLSLFNNGVWLYGKRFWKGNIRKFLVVLLVKIVCLPFLQLGAAMACDLPVPAAMSLIMLSVCPVSSMSFVVSSQYNHGADIVTMVTVAGTLLLVPLVLAALELPKEWGFYDYDVSEMPLD